MSENEEIEEDQCGVTDPYFRQCIWKYGHEGIHEFPKEDEDQGELF